MLKQTTVETFLLGLKTFHKLIYIFKHLEFQFHALAFFVSQTIFTSSISFCRMNIIALFCFLPIRHPTQFSSEKRDRISVLKMNFMFMLLFSTLQQIFMLHFPLIFWKQCFTNLMHKMLMHRLLLAQYCSYLYDPYCTAFKYF